MSRTFTQAEIDEVIKGNRWLSGTEQELLRKQRDREAAAAKANGEATGRVVEGERWERFKAKVKKEEKERVEADRTDAETLAAMTVEQQVRHFNRHPPDIGERPPHLPPRYMMALEDIRRDELEAANAELEERNRRAGLPKAQADWHKRQDAILKAPTDR